MNEYLVWNKKKKSFSDGHWYRIRPDGSLWKLFAGMQVDCSETHTAYKFAGKKDNENEKIYEESSIVDFEWFDTRFKTLQREQGYFKENRYNKCLEFVHLDSYKSNINFVQHIEAIKSIKIIDTIQENKLGLIKIEKENKRPYRERLEIRS